MVKGCKHLCVTAFKNLCKKSIIHEVKRKIWKFCKSCSIYLNYRCLKSWICPCCHNQLRDKRRDISSTWYQRRQEYYKKKNREYYHRNKEKWKVYKSKNTKSLEEIAEIMK